MEAEWLAKAIQEQERFLENSGRVLVRASGTEALIRVMVEAKEEQIAQQSAQTLVEVIKKHENLE